MLDIDDITSASDTYRRARDTLAVAVRDAERDERHWRESAEYLRKAEGDMRSAREALLRLIGTVPAPQLAQEV